MKGTKNCTFDLKCTKPLCGYKHSTPSTKSPAYFEEKKEEVK